MLQRRHCADPGGRKLEAEGNIDHQKEQVSNKVHWPLQLSCFILRTRADQLLERLLLSREAVALPSAEFPPLRKQTLSTGPVQCWLSWGQALQISDSLFELGRQGILRPTL